MGRDCFVRKGGDTTGKCLPCRVDRRGCKPAGLSEELVSTPIAPTKGPRPRVKGPSGPPASSIAPVTSSVAQSSGPSRLVLDVSMDDDVQIVDKKRSFNDFMREPQVGKLHCSVNTVYGTLQCSRQTRVRWASLNGQIFGSTYTVASKTVPWNGLRPDSNFLAFGIGILVMFLVYLNDIWYFRV
jgi:hypothetical protein